jgi:hypothetical protein
MPRGIHLNQTQKQQIYVGITKGHDGTKIIESVFVADDISPTYISKTIRWLKNVATNDQIVSWLAGKIRTGNKSSNALDDPITESLEKNARNDCNRLNGYARRRYYNMSPGYIFLSQAP